MKKIVHFFALLLACVSVHAQTPDTLRVLCIGNSFSVDAVEQNLYELGASRGHILIIGNLYIGGCTLERHALNAAFGNRDYSYRKIGADGVKTVYPEYSLEDGLADERWDAVSFQQGSPRSGLVASYEPHLTTLIAYVRARTEPGVRLLLHQTWAYAKGSGNPNFDLYGYDQTAMYRGIMDASEKMASAHSMVIIPCGTAIQNYRATWFRDNVTRDGYHLNRTGRFIAASTWFGALTGDDVLKTSYAPDCLDDWQLRAALHSAAEALKSPYAVTDFGMRENAVNYDESLIPRYVLPEMLRTSKGRTVKNAAVWKNERRPELYALFESEMFGKVPEAAREALPLKSKVLEESRGVLGGIADRRQVSISFGKGRAMTLLIYTPAGAKRPVPAFLGINFKGNYSVCDDPDILFPSTISLLQKRYGIIPELGQKDTVASVRRGSAASRWPLEKILAAGYGLVTFYRGDVDPDFDDSFGNGVHSVFYQNGQTYPEPDEWGTIAAWAWALSRALDYLEEDPSVDASRVAVLGHSRLGKTALWAGASDPRFALVISNNSGCGGAALSRRGIGETVQIINRSFPHWFCRNFRKYGGAEESLPFDQHELLALIAPRPLYVASASQDRWADPKGEFLSAVEASRVYGLFGYRGLTDARMPEPGEQIVSDRMAYHLREGKHDITEFDWERYIAFADKFLK